MGLNRYLAVLVLAAGCSDDGAGSQAGSFALTPAQFGEELSAGAQRVEVTLRADGSVREVEIEAEGPGHAQQLAGRVLAVDAAAQSIEVEYLGRVDFSGAQRFRTLADSSVDQATWLGAVQAAGPIFIDVRGTLGDGVFVASEVRWEDEGRTKLEVDVDRVALDLGAGTLTVGEWVFRLDGAALRSDDGNDGNEAGDDNGNDGPEVGDDNGNDGNEAGDDNGNDGPEVGDDNGNDGPEVGDDNGNDGPEVGDDNGNDGPEAGDDNGNDGPEAGDDNGNDGPEAGDDNGNDGPEAGDDNGNDGPEAGDDNGGDAPEAGDDNGGEDEDEDNSGHGGDDEPEDEDEDNSGHGGDDPN